MKGSGKGNGNGEWQFWPWTPGRGGEEEVREERLFQFQGPATTGKKSLGVSDLIDKDTRAQGRRMTLDG